MYSLLTTVFPPLFFSLLSAVSYPTNVRAPLSASEASSTGVPVKITSMGDWWNPLQVCKIILIYQRQKLWKLSTYSKFSLPCFLRTIFLFVAPLILSWAVLLKQASWDGRRSWDLLRHTVGAEWGQANVPGEYEAEAVQVVADGCQDCQAPGEVGYQVVGDSQPLPVLDTGSASRA